MEDLGAYPESERTGNEFWKAKFPEGFLMTDAEGVPYVNGEIDYPGPEFGSAEEARIRLAAEGRLRDPEPCAYLDWEGGRCLYWRLTRTDGRKPA